MWIGYFSPVKTVLNIFLTCSRNCQKKYKFGVMGSGSENALRSFGHQTGLCWRKCGQIVRMLGQNLQNWLMVLPFCSRRQKTRCAVSTGHYHAETKIIDLPVYETVLEEDAEASAAEVLIFTSPSNVEAYFAR